jgi:hypothetical protein
MIVSPLDILDPVFDFLDGVVLEWGVYLFIVFVLLSVLVLAWVFSGGLRRKFPDQPHVSARFGIVMQPHSPPPPPIIIFEYHPPEDGLD